MKDKTPIRDEGVRDSGLGFYFYFFPGDYYIANSIVILGVKYMHTLGEHVKLDESRVLW